MAFQGNAFQNNAFQTSIVVSSLKLPFPINCVLMGEQLYDRSGHTFEKGRGKSGTRMIAGTNGSVRLGAAPSFSVSSTKRGYD